MLYLVHISSKHGPSCLCNPQEWTPLHSAVSAGHTEIVQALISGGADVNVANSGGQTALHYAVRSLLLTWCEIGVISTSNFCSPRVFEVFIVPKTSFLGYNCTHCCFGRLPGGCSTRRLHDGVYITVHKQTTLLYVFEIT